MTDTNPEPAVNEDKQPVENKSTQDEVQEKTDNNVPVESLQAVDAQHESRENSSEPQFTDAEKAVDDDEVVEEEDEGNDSEYEDVDDEEEEEEETTETKKEDDDEHINIKPRRLPKKQEEEAEAEEEVDNETKDSTEKPTQQTDKKSDKNKEKVEGDNDTDNPAYVPRKGKFYEHDDRTNDESDQSKPEPNKGRNRPTYKDSDSKWQHDLYMDYEEDGGNYFPSNNRGQSTQRGGGRGRGGGGGGRRGNRGRGGGGGNSRDQLQIDDYIPPPQRGRGAYHQQGTDQRRRPHPNDRQRNDRTNNFDVEDYNRPSSSSTQNKQGRGNRTNFSEQSGPPRQQRRDFEQYQVDEFSRRNQPSSATTNDQSFHRERNFTNTQYQHQRTAGDGKGTHTNKRTGGQQSFEFQQEDNRGKNPMQKRDNNTEPPRRQGNNSNNNRNPQRQNDNQGDSMHFSADASNFERTKRYSNMRNNTNQQPNSGQQQSQHQHPHPPSQQQQQQQHSQQQQQQQQQTQIPLQSYQEPRNNYFDQSNWQRAGPPTQNTFLPQQQQMMPQQMYHPQQQMSPSTYYVQSHYQQQPPPPPHQQYVPINYAQGSIPSQRQENK